MFKEEVTDMLNTLTEWLANSGIGKTPAKREAIAKELFWPVFTHNIQKEQIQKLQYVLNYCKQKSTAIASYF